MAHPPGYVSSSEVPENEVQSAPPAYSSFKPRLASISLHESDCLRVLQFPQRDINALREIIKQSWVKGIQSEHPIQSWCYEFKLSGTPWNPSLWTGSESSTSRILMREILAYLFSMGWILRGSNNGVFFFHLQPVPPECDWISITYHGSDRLRLIGASTELKASFADMLKRMGRFQDAFWKEEENNAWEFKIKGRMWATSDEDAANNCLLLLRIVETLETHGWRTYSNTMLNLASQNGRISFSNGWFCMKNKQWAPAATIRPGLEADGF